jgi:hypothetical protein
MRFAVSHLQLLSFLVATAAGCDGWIKVFNFPVADRPNAISGAGGQPKMGTQRESTCSSGNLLGAKGGRDLRFLFQADAALVVSTGNAYLCASSISRRVFLAKTTSCPRAIHVSKTTLPTS